MFDSWKRARVALVGCIAVLLSLLTPGCHARVDAAPTTAAAPSTQPATPAFEQLAGKLKPADFGGKAILIVHYRRLDDKYDKWNLWAWEPQKPGRSVAFNATTTYGRYAVVPFAEIPKSVGLIVRKGEWESKDGDRDREVSFDGRNVAEVWLVSGDEKVHKNPKTVDLSVRLVSAFLDGPRHITFATTGALSHDQLNHLAVTSRTDGRHAVSVRGASMVDDVSSARVIYRMELAAAVADADVAALSIGVKGNTPLAPVTVFARDILKADRFSPTEAVLGYTCTKTQTTFQTWSPVADTVDLVLYDSTGPAAKPTKVLPMTRVAGGVWTGQLPGDLHGVAYRYRFNSYGQLREVPDIHTKAASADSSFSIIVDLDRAAPAGWGTVPAPALKRPTDEIIYEIHVRDFSITDESTPKKQRGTYLGLVHSNPAKPPKVSTGLSHLKDLGVTAVHLLPIHDFTAQIGEYNWGYWTALFNVPEANYATDPRDPMLPIVELRQSVQELHRAGIRVILDVVYNHTSSSFEHSPFDQTVPYYYFRTSPDGRLLNDAGVGNSMADERPMVRKYIVDSVAFWATQYRIDGFRFDLLGTHHRDTVKSVCDRLLAIRPDITLYGEPWTGGGPTHFGKGAQRGMRMAVFNDHLRNAIRGDLDGTALGFATGKPDNDVPNIRNGVAGAIDDFTDHPIETINYVSAHDNLTLWDKLVKSQPLASDKTRRDMHKLAHGIVLTSQGIPFIHGGCDFARTKGGNHNSYNAGDEVNKFDWARKQEYADVYEYVRGLIALRKAHPAFRLTTREQIREVVKFHDFPEGVAFTLDGKSAGDSWHTILVIYNPQPNPVTTDLPPGTWTVVVNESQAGTTKLSDAKTQLTLPPYSMWIGHKD